MTNWRSTSLPSRGWHNPFHRESVTDFVDEWKFEEEANVNKGEIFNRAV